MHIHGRPDVARGTRSNGPCIPLEYNTVQLYSLWVETAVRPSVRPAVTLAGLLLTWCFTSTETIRLIWDRRMEVGKREIIYLSLHCHQQDDSCIKMGSDDSHFNVSLIVKDKVTRQCPQTTTFEEKGEPKWNPDEVSAYQPYR